MIDIRNTAGLSLLLDAGTVLTIEQSAGWLTDDNLPGGFSYPISFPLNPENKRFLGFSYRPDAARPSMTLSVTLRIEGTHYRKCTLSFRIENGRGDGYLKIDAGEVYETWQGMTLPDAMGDTTADLDPTGGHSLAQCMNRIAAAPIGSEPLTFFPVRNSLFFEPELDAVAVPDYVAQPIVNPWRNNDGFVMDEVLVKGRPVVPFLFMTTVLGRVFDQIQYRVQGDWLGDPETASLTIFNLTAIDAYRGRWGVGRYLVRYRDHVPDMAVSEFLKALRQRFGLLFVFDSTARTCTIRRWVDLVRSAAQVFDAELLAGYGLAEPDARGFTILDGQDGADELYRDIEGNAVGPVPLVVGSGGQAITLRSGTCQMAYEYQLTYHLTTGAIGTGAARWLIPTVRQAGNIADDNYLKSSRQPDKNLAWKNAVSLRLLSYRGMQPNSAGQLYPLATSGVLNAMMDEIAPVGVELTGERGLWRNSLYMYYAFRDGAQKLTARLLPSAAQLSRFRFDEPIALSIEGHRRTYVAERYQAQTPGPSGKLLTRLEAYTMPPGLEQSLPIVERTVWVEFLEEIISTVSDSLYGGDDRGLARLYTGTKQVVKLTVKTWYDRQKTQPATVVVALNLMLTLNSFDRKKTVDSVESDRLITYTVGGPLMVIENGIEKQFLILDERGIVQQKTRKWAVASGNYRII